MSIQASVFSAPPAAGFVESVQDSQNTFRAALQAMAHPGRVQTLMSTCAVPAGISVGMAAFLLTLIDVDTPVWLPADIDDEVRHFLRFHCGCPFVSEPMLARFVVVPMGFEAPSLLQCHQGDPAFPDLSATLLLEVQTLDNSMTSHAVVLKGPGIQTQQILSVTGLPSDFWTQWKLNHQLFPLGVDAFLIQANQVCGLPRTVSAEG
jgi:alpha-D-ribose 1-methylphosphonate 5-triphosphate synthase subunit PhnH